MAHAFMCSICQELTNFVSYRNLTAEIQKHQSLHPGRVSSVTITYDPDDETEPYLSTFINWRVAYKDKGVGDAPSST